MKKKLSLNKETVSRLNNEEMHNAQGGAAITSVFPKSCRVTKCAKYTVCGLYCDTKTGKTVTKPDNSDEAPIGGGGFQVGGTGA